MPIKIPDKLPAFDALVKEGMRMMTETVAIRQDIRPLQIGLLTSAATAAFALIALPAGALVDRHAKRRLMIWCDAARLVIIGLNEDDSPELMLRYLADRGLGWEQRYIGSSDDPNLPARQPTRGIRTRETH